MHYSFQREAFSILLKGEKRKKNPMQRSSFAKPCAEKLVSVGCLTLSLFYFICCFQAFVCVCIFSHAVFCKEGRWKVQSVTKQVAFLSKPGPVRECRGVKSSRVRGACFARCCLSLETPS